MKIEITHSEGLNIFEHVQRHVEMEENHLKAHWISKNCRGRKNSVHVHANAPKGKNTNTKVKLGAPSKKVIQKRLCYAKKLKFRICLTVIRRDTLRMVAPD